jgi:glycosyltransferase involved in cell wall biosynthesis
MNGVDADLFKPGDRAAARAELGLPPGPLVVYVGNLKPEKGVGDHVRAWPAVLEQVPDATLAIVGGGPLRSELEAAIKPYGERVKLVGPQPLEQVPVWMAACDVLTLPSHNEGTPNVVLEALASGRRVVATSVGGIPDLITSPVLGALVPVKDEPALAAALALALRTPYEPGEVARLGARGGWAASATALHAVLADAANARVA